MTDDLRRGNLLAKDNWRAALADEVEPDGPEVSLVEEATVPAGGGEGLAGAGSSPDGLVVGPASEPEGVGPGADTGEEVGLDGVSDVSWSEVSDAPLIDFPAGDIPAANQVPQPVRGVRLDLVVEGAHTVPASPALSAARRSCLFGVVVSMNSAYMTACLSEARNSDVCR